MQRVAVSGWIRRGADPGDDVMSINTLALKKILPRFAYHHNETHLRQRLSMPKSFLIASKRYGKRQKHEKVEENEIKMSENASSTPGKIQE